MKYLIILLLLIFSSMSYGQKIEEVNYYYKNSKLKISGYKINQMKDSIWNYYDTIGIKRVSGRFKCDKMNGIWTYFYSNRNNAIIGTYKEDKKNGIWNFYNLKGKIMSRGSFDNDKTDDNSWVYYDTLGNEVKNDSIMIIEDNPADFYYLEKPGYRSFDGFIPATPTFVNGYGAIHDYFAEHINIPAYIREENYNVSYKCYIQFIICKNGTVSDVRVLKSFNQDFDNNVLQLFNNIPIFLPATYNGIAVKTKYVLPFKYKVGNPK